MHRNEIIYALICINNHVLSCLISMLSQCHTTPHLSSLLGDNFASYTSFSTPLSYLHFLVHSLLSHFFFILPLSRARKIIFSPAHKKTVPPISLLGFRLTFQLLLGHYEGEERVEKKRREKREERERENNVFFKV